MKLSVSFLEPKIWDLVSNELESVRNLTALKRKPTKDGHHRYVLEDFE